MENIGHKTVVTSGISSLYAAGEMAGENSNELDIFVEDSTAKSLIELSLSNETRLRVNVLDIGSSSAVIRQLTERYKNIKKGECVAILDGDKRTKIVSLYNQFVHTLESVDNKGAAESYIKERLNFLPGDTWPENWLFLEIKQRFVSELGFELSIDEDLLSECLEEAIRAGKHNEFHAISKRTNLNISDIANLFCRHAVRSKKEEFGNIEKFILRFLK